MQTKGVPNTGKIAIGVVLSLILLVFGVANNVGASMMSYSMKAYPAWLLYGTSMIYTVGFWLLAFIFRENPLSKPNRTWEFQRHYLLLSFLAAMGGMWFQFVASWVTGTVSQILTNLTILQIPVFEVMLIPSRRREYRDPRQIIGLLFVGLGIALGVVHVFIELKSDSQNSNNINAWYWILIFGVSTIFTALQQIFTDKALNDERCKQIDDNLTSSKNPGMREFSCLAWYNLYSIPFYLLSIPLETVQYVNGTPNGKSISDAFQNQKNAFICFGSNNLDQSGCSKGSTAWPLVFCAGYIGLYAANTRMIKRYGVLFPNLLGATIQLISAMVFTTSTVFNSASPDKFSAWPIGGCIAILIGVIIRQSRRSKVLERQQIYSLVSLNDDDNKN